MRTSQDIIKDITRFEPIDDNWLKLHSLLDELLQTGDQENFTVDLLGVFERFPESDGNEVFWSIVHAIEGFKEYESELIASVNRQPSEMGLIMLKRIQNSRTKAIEKVENKI